MGKILPQVPKNPASFFGLTLLLAFNKSLIHIRATFLILQKNEVMFALSLRMSLIFFAKPNKLMIKKKALLIKKNTQQIKTC